MFEWDCSIFIWCFSHEILMYMCFIAYGFLSFELWEFVVRVFLSDILIYQKLSRANNSNVDTNTNTNTSKIGNTNTKSTKILTLILKILILLVKYTKVILLVKYTELANVLLDSTLTLILILVKSITPMLEVQK